MPSSASTQKPYADLPSEQVAILRKGIRAALSAGYKLPDIEQDVQAKYGVSVKQVMEPSPSDFGRSVAQGLTFNHADELAGLFAKLGGGSYTSTRDQVRQNDAAFAAEHPFLNFATSAVAGGIPGLAAAPLSGIEKGAHLTNTLRSAAVGAGAGALAGEGGSNSTTFAGVVGDAGVGAAIGGTLGAGIGYGVSKLASASIPGHNAGAVSKEVATQMPTDPVAATNVLVRQEKLVPGTVVLADHSPEMQKFVRIIGADRKTAMVAADETQKRVAAIQAAKRGVGQSYDDLKGVAIPVDDQLKAIAKSVGGRGVPRSGDVDLGALHELRSALRAEARATRNGFVAAKKTEAANALTDWMSQQAPWLKQVDADYAFLTGRLKAAQGTLKAVKASNANYAANRAAGVEPGSVGATIPMPGQSTIGTVVNQVFKPSRSARARAMYNLLFTPQRDATGIEGLVQLHNVLASSPESPAAATAAGVLSAGVAPRAKPPER